jgi:hypothetical protein
MRVKLADVHTRQDGEIGLTDAKAAAHREWQNFNWRIEHREQGGLRRCVDAWARHLAAEQLASKIEQQKSPQSRRTEIVNRFPRRAPRVRSV